MQFGGNNMLGFVIVSLGILGIIVSFLVTDRKKYITALILSMFVIAMGLFQSVSSSVRQWQTQRRIANLQEQQRLNLQALIIGFEPEQKMPPP